jgi:hypothetical protein
MAAGLGYIEFTTGDILTAASANGYLASQTVMVFADAAARTAAITSPQEGMVSYLKDTNAIQYYSGSAWVSVGGGSQKVAQVLSTTKTDTFSSSIVAGGNAAVTGLSQSITPSSATSKVLVTLTMNGYNGNWGGFGGYIARDTTAIGIGDAASNRTRVASAAFGDPNHMITVTMSFLDSPATTSAVTYNGYVVNAQPATRTVYVNRTETDTDARDFSRGASTITVMEILA